MKPIWNVLFGAALLVQVAQANPAQVISKIVNDFSSSTQYVVQMDVPAGTVVSDPGSFSNNRIDLKDLSMTFDIAQQAEPQMFVKETVYRTVKNANIWALVFKRKSGQLGFIATVPSKTFKGLYVACDYKTASIKKSEKELEQFLKICQSAQIIKTM
jgi:hypothetical protein